MLFFSLIGGAVGLPIPEDVPLIAAGIIAQVGTAPPELLFIVCYVAIILGDLIIFFAGRKLGPALFTKSWFKKKLSASKIRRFRLGLEKRSLPTIFLARHLFYLRTVTFLACGAVKMKPSRFLAADALSALVSTPIMMTIGYFAAEHWEEVVQNIQYGMLALGVLLIGGYFVLRRRKKRAQEEQVH